MSLTQTQINYIKAELESIASDEEVFPGFLPEVPAERKLELAQARAKKLLDWIEFGMKINETPYEGESVEDNIFRA